MDLSIKKEYIGSDVITENLAYGENVENSATTEPNITIESGPDQELSSGPTPEPYDELESVSTSILASTLNQMRRSGVEKESETESSSISPWWAEKEVSSEMMVDPAPPRMDHADGPIRSGKTHQAQGRYGKRMSPFRRASSVATDTGNTIRSTSQPRSWSSLSNISMEERVASWKDLLVKEMKLKHYFQVKYDRLRLQLLFPFDDEQ